MGLELTFSITSTNGAGRSFVTSQQPHGDNHGSRSVNPGYSAIFHPSNQADGRPPTTPRQLQLGPDLSSNQLTRHASEDLNMFD